MRRLLAATALVAAAAGVMPANASQPLPGGQCDGKVDVVCRENECVPDYPCTIVICLVWVGGTCKY